MTPVTNIIIPPVTAAVSSKKMPSLPKDLFSSIFQCLGAKDLQNAEGVSKSWQQLTEDSHVWNPIREKLKISGTKNEILEYIKGTLPKINVALVKVLPEPFREEILSINHPFEQFVAIENRLKLLLKMNTFKTEIRNNTYFFIRHIDDIKTFPPSPMQVRALQFLLDHGVVPFEEKKSSWGNVIFYLNYPKGFEAALSLHGEAAVVTPIRINNEAFARFLLNKEEYSKDSSVIIRSLLYAIAYGEVHGWWDFPIYFPISKVQGSNIPIGEVNNSIINLIVNSLKKVNGLKSIFEAEVKSRSDAITRKLAGHHAFGDWARETMAAERLQKGVEKLGLLLFQEGK